MSTPTLDALPPRKPGLGRYHGTREEWRDAYRAARVRLRQGQEPTPTVQGLAWKADLVVNFDRSPHADPLSFPLVARAEAMRIVSEIIGERKAAP